MNIAVIIGAWMAYLTFGILVAIIPRWADPSSLRGLAASALPIAFGLTRSMQSGDLSYAVAGLLATVMVYALVKKKAEDRA